MTVALETIDYQHKDAFPGQLASLIQVFYNDLRTGKYASTEQLVTKHPRAKEVEALIRDRFNLNIELQHNLHVLSPAAIIPFFGDYYKRDLKTTGFFNVFGINYQKVVTKLGSIIKERKDTLRKIHDKTGFINLKLARVGGYLSEVRHYLIIDFKWMLDHDISEDELVAIVLHEIGHAFDGLEEHYRLESTNRTILDILTDLNDNKVDSAKYHFRSKFNRSDFEKAQLDTEKDRQDFCGELARLYVSEIKSQMQSSKYDETNFENMADTFATRFGMGKHLVAGLHKLMSAYGAVYKNTRTNRLIAYSLDAFILAAMFLLIPVYGSIVFFLVVSYLSNTSNTDYTYDKPLDRYQRVRNTIVNALKKLDLPKEVLKDLLEQLEHIDAIINTTAERDSGLFRLVGDMLSSDSRKDKYYIDLQRTIEDSLNNQLFVKSAQLRVS